MKIAVCISGGVRYPHLGLASIQKIIPNSFVKVFIHTWKVSNVNGFVQTLAGMEHKEVDKVIEQDLSFLQNYNYEKLLIENYEAKKENFDRLLDNLRFAHQGRQDCGPISMHYSIYQANKLKKEYEEDNNMIFDWVIRMRTDSEFLVDQFDASALSSDFIIPAGEDWGTPHGINDQFAMGKSHQMDLYSSLYKHILYTQDSNYAPEIILCTHLKKMNLVPDRIDFPVRINNGMDFRRYYPDIKPGM